MIDSLKGKEIDSAYENILWQIRMPRALAAAILGGALGLAGYLLQTFFRNPIAGPFVLGISSGAKLAVALVMVFFLGQRVNVGSGVLITAAFAGALFSMGVVILISGRVRSMSMLIVSGVMIGYICSAITDFVVTFAQDADIVNLHNWSMGSFSGITWDNVTVMSVFVLAATGIVFWLAKPIGAYQMGESFCVSMGINLPRLKVLLVLLSSLLAACITAFAGPVSFVGIAVPHLVKQLFRTTKPIVMIPACFLGGSVFCLFCDLLARTLFAPTELSISTVTAVFGAPVVLAVMIRKKKAGE
jgi:iron complex transport system permease protein